VELSTGNNKTTKGQEYKKTGDQNTHKNSEIWETTDKVNSKHNGLCTQGNDDGVTRGTKRTTKLETRNQPKTKYKSPNERHDASCQKWQN